MIAIDKYAYISGMKDVNPLFKILFGGLSLAACVCSRSLLSFLIVFVGMSVVTAARAKIPVGYYVKLMILPLCFLLAGVIGIIVNYTTASLPEHCVFHSAAWDGHVFISREGVTTALRLTCRAMAAVSCLYFLVLTTPVRDIVHFLRILRCPQVIVTLMLLVYQFIFLLLDTAAIKMKSQLCRGGYRSVKAFPKTFGMLWGSVFVQAFRKADWVFKSMSARGYEGETRFLPRGFRINVCEAILLVLFVVIVLLPNLL